jgi:acid phosphatase (class A)
LLAATSSSCLAFVFRASLPFHSVQRFRLPASQFFLSPIHPLQSHAMKTRSLASLALLALVATASQARDPVLLPAQALPSAQLLSTPAAVGTPELAQELAQMHRVENARTPSQTEQAKADDADESVFLFASALGSAFKPEALPLTTALAAKAKADAGVVGSAPKQAFQRAHPYHADATLKPVCPTKTKQDSYPSGHTLAGYLQALVLIDLVPEQHDAILQRAAAYAHNRVVCGVNYPSDLEASRLLAYSAFAVMSVQPGYREEAAAARTELRKVLGLPARVR